MLAKYNVTVKYIPRAKNLVTDTFSRMVLILVALKIVKTLSIWESIQKDILDDNDFEKLQAELEVIYLLSKPVKNFEVNSTSVLVYKTTRVCMLKTCQITLLCEYHDVPMAGHPRINKLTATLKQQFYWLKMKQDVRNYVNSCLNC